MEAYLLLNHHHPSTFHRLLQAVLLDLQMSHYVVDIRALGIIDQVIWRHLE